MPVPKRKRSRTRRDKRFANKGMMVHSIAACKNCNNPLLPHVACLKCGFYKGIKVINTKGERLMARMQNAHKQQAYRNQAAASSEAAATE